mgnify:CR=1 FL=1
MFRESLDALPRAPGGSARRALGARDGQSMVEFALIVPLLLLLVFGIIEFGNAWRTSQLLTNFAREGARRAVVPNAPSDNQLRQDIQAMMSANGLSTSAATIEFACGGTFGGTCGTGSSGTPETVRISYNYGFDFFGPRFGSITLQTESTMRNE